MPETHDTDFRWEDFVERTNNELIGTYGNFVHRVMTLTHRLTNEGENPLIRYDSCEFNHETKVLPEATEFCDGIYGKTEISRKL